jgi:hypothetical protein
MYEIWEKQQVRKISAVTLEEMRLFGRPKCA